MTVKKSFFGIVLVLINGLPLVFHAETIDEGEHERREGSSHKIRLEYEELDNKPLFIDKIVNITEEGLFYNAHIESDCVSETREARPKSVKLTSVTDIKDAYIVEYINETIMMDRIVSIKISKEVNKGRVKQLSTMLLNPGLSKCLPWVSVYQETPQKISVFDTSVKGEEESAVRSLFALSSQGSEKLSKESSVPTLGKVALACNNKKSEVGSPVTIYYLDQWGQSISDLDVISGHVTIPYLTTPKVIPGYKLDNVMGIEKGIFDRVEQAVVYTYLVG